MNAWLRTLWIVGLAVGLIGAPAMAQDDSAEEQPEAESIPMDEIGMGGGGAALKLTARQPTDFTDAVTNPANTVLDRSFFALRPDVNLGLQVLPWMSLNVSGGYLLTFGDDWSHQGTALPGPPTSFNAWTIQVMLQFGGRG